MPLIFLEMSSGLAMILLIGGGAGGLYSMVHQPWFWVIFAMIAYLAFEMIRARNRQKRREGAEANRSPNSN